MANVIKIKRSQITATPATLAEGELAFSELSGKLFIGTSGENISIIGGTDYLPEGFSTIAVSGQNSVVAATSESTLNLAAGTNISIATDALTNTVTISAVIDEPPSPYAEGVGIDIVDSTISLDLSELTTSVTDGNGDFFVVVDDANAQYKLTKANIALSGFNNDLGWTSNTGTVTSVSAGNGLDFVTFTDFGSIVLGLPSTLTATSINEVTATSHTHEITGFIPTTSIDTDGTLAANSDVLIASQKAVKTYVDGIIAAANALVYMGVIDASLNPDYPAGDAGNMYLVSVAGKIGGVDGVSVEVGDMVICLVDGTLSGDQATVGTSWNVVQANLTGVVMGPTSSVDGNIAVFDGVSGKLIKDSGLTISGTNTGDVTVTGSSYLSLIGQEITASTVTVADGGTGLTSIAVNTVLYGSGTGVLNVASAGTEGQVFQAGVGGVPVFADLDGGTF